jgi:hypothetical protein
MARVGGHFLAAVTVALIAVAGVAGGCGQNNNASSFGTGPLSSYDATAGDDGSSEGGPGLLFPPGSSGGFNIPGSPPPPACEGGHGWHCSVDTNCSTPTSLSGKVFDPAGKNPLYDVVVFIPNDPSNLPGITQGTKSCNTCDVSIGDYVAAGLTDYTGSFKLTGVPTAKGVPVTVQIGKWRRTIAVDIDNDCSSNTVSTSPTSKPLLRLPAKKSEGDMPQMALLTGGCDDMACFLMNVGIDSSEFTGPHAGGRVDVYQGISYPLGLIAAPGPGLSNGTPGNCTGNACPLWASRQSFESYDLAMFSCQCGEGTGMTESPAAYTALRDWLDEGGKVFASHYHYTWFENNPSADFKGVANWGNTGNNDIASSTGQTYDLDTSFPKAVTFGQWLGVVGAINSPGGGPPMYSPPPNIKLSYVADSMKTVNATANRWIYDPATGMGEGGTANDVKYMSFGTPIGGAPIPDGGPEGGKQYCGKAVYTDLHTGGSLLAQAKNVPGDCMAGDLSAQQKALEFLFFDLAACVTDDKQPPPGPPPRPPQ